jgi:predicted RNA-binding Zn-ribbon protein involved in translation (DUF1610 family)
MSVVVVKKEPHSSVVKEIVCGKCGATLQYTPNDVRRRDGHDYSGGPDGEEWVNCPNCGKKAIIRSW